MGLTLIAASCGVAEDVPGHVPELAAANATDTQGTGPRTPAPGESEFGPAEGVARAPADMPPGAPRDLPSGTIHIATVRSDTRYPDLSPAVTSTSREDGEALAASTWAVPVEAPPVRLPAGAPAMLMHLSPGVRANRNLPRVVFLHGYSACIRALADSGSTACGDGLPTRPGWGLTAAADASGQALALLLPQLAFLRRDGSVGTWRGDDVAGRDLREALRQGYEASGRGEAPPGPWVVVAHSGGFAAAAAVVDGGGLDVHTLVLLDALYEAVPRFARWLGEDPSRRLVSVHRTGGTPARMTRALARRIGRTSGEDAVAEVPMERLAEALATHRLVTIQVRTPHAEIPSRHLAAILRAVLPEASREPDRAARRLSPQPPPTQ